MRQSGAGAIADCTVLGMHGNGPTWDDLDEVQMASIGPTQLHRAVDLEIFSADDEGQCLPREFLIKS
jgi:hypothetical protein